MAHDETLARRICDVLRRAARRTRGAQQHRGQAVTFTKDGEEKYEYVSFSSALEFPTHP